MEKVRAKVCGVMTPRDGVVVGEAGADFMGVILSPGYARSVAHERALAIYEAAPARRVGVFVDAAADEVIRVAEALGLDVIQLSGSEPTDVVARIGAAGRWGVWKTVHAGAPVAEEVRVVAEAAVPVAEAAVSVAEAGAPVAEAAVPYAAVADGILVDSGDCGRPGGTGRTFRWEGVGRQVRRAIGSATFIAAGGMNPRNAAVAVRVLAPDVLDVSSGVEAVPGTKDPGRTRAFVRAVKLAGREGAERW